MLVLLQVATQTAEGMSGSDVGAGCFAIGAVVAVLYALKLALFGKPGRGHWD